MAAVSMAGAVNGIASKAGANKVAAVKIVVGITAAAAMEVRGSMLIPMM